jgi:hypothetical protein
MDDPTELTPVLLDVDYAAAAVQKAAQEWDAAALECVGAFREATRDSCARNKTVELLVQYMDSGAGEAGAGAQLVSLIAKMHHNSELLSDTVATVSLALKQAIPIGSGHDIVASIATRWSSSTAVAAQSIALDLESSMEAVNTSFAKASKLRKLSVGLPPFMLDAGNLVIELVNIVLRYDLAVENIRTLTGPALNALVSAIKREGAVPEGPDAVVRRLMQPEGHRASGFG